MPLLCGKNLEQESIKDVQNEMKDFMKLGRAKLANIKQSNLAKQLDVNKLKTVPKKLKEVTITGYTNIVTIPEDTYLIATVYGKKPGSGQKFLILDYVYDKPNNTVSTKEKVSELIVTVAVPDGAQEINLQEEIGKLQGTTDVNSFLEKAQEIQLKFGSATPAPDTADVTESVENSSTINLSDKPINILKVNVMKQGTNWFGGTNSYRLDDTVVSLYVPGEPNKPYVAKKIKVKYTVPGTSSVAMGTKGNFDINQILAKVTKDKNFTTNDLKSLDNAKVKGLMGSYEKDIAKGLNNLDTSAMGKEERDLINQFKGGIGNDGKLNLSNLDTDKIFGSANQIASIQSKGKIEEQAVNKLLKGDLVGAFQEGRKLNTMGGSKFPGVPSSFDLTKNTDPTSALTGLLNLQTASPSVSTLTTVEYSETAIGNTVKSVTLTKPIISIVSVEGNRAGTNVFSNVSFTKNQNKITTTNSYKRIKVTYKTPAPKIKPGEAFGERKIDTCKDIPEIKVVIQDFKKEDLLAGKTISDFTTVQQLSKPKKVPETKPKAIAIEKPTLNLNAKSPYSEIGITLEEKEFFEKTVTYFESLIDNFYQPEVSKLESEIKAYQEKPEYKKIYNIQRANNNKDAETLLSEGKITPEDMQVLVEIQDENERYLDLTFSFTDGKQYPDQGIIQTVADFTGALSNANVLIAVTKICLQGDDKSLAAKFQKDLNDANKIIQKITPVFDNANFTKEDTENLEKIIPIVTFRGPPKGFASVEEATKARSAFIKHFFEGERLNQKTIDLINDKQVIQNIIPIN